MRAHDFFLKKRVHKAKAVSAGILEVYLRLRISEFLPTGILLLYGNNHSGGTVGSMARVCLSPESSII